LLENNPPQYRLAVKDILNVCNGRSKSFIRESIKADIKIENDRKLHEKFHDHFDPSFKINFEVDNNGVPLPTQRNIQMVLLQSKKVPLVYDEFSGKCYYEIYNGMELPWNHHLKGDYFEIKYYDDHAIKQTKFVRYYNANTTYQLAELKDYLSNFFRGETRWQALKDAMLVAARKNVINLYQDFLTNGLPEWDHVDRMDFLYRFAGARDKQWANVVGHSLFLGLMARCFDPGYDYRGVVVLEGPEESGKSRLCRLLALHPSFYIQFQFNRNTEGYEITRQIAGKPIVEMPEGGNIKSRDRDVLKAWITNTHDANRAMHQNEVEYTARVGILIITTNETGNYLPSSNSNEPSNTRFNPIYLAAREIDLDALELEIPQLYAQAKYLWEMGVSPRLTEAERNLRRTEVEPRETKPLMFHTLLTELKLRQNEVDDGFIIPQCLEWIESARWFNPEKLHIYKKDIIHVLKKYFQFDNVVRYVPKHLQKDGVDTVRKYYYVGKLKFEELLTKLERDDEQ
jgi:hypothetical protein